MSSVIISEEKVIELGKLCLSNLRNLVNDEYFLGFNEVKRLRTLFFLACQKVFFEQIISKEKEYSILNNIIELFDVNINEVWNEKLEEKFYKALMITKKSKIGNYYKIEEVFNTPVFEKYSKVEFSLKEIYRIIDLIDEGVNKCCDLNEDLYCDIKTFKKKYHVYKILDID